MSSAKIYPINENGEPSLTIEFIKSLNEECKINYASAIKNDGDEFYINDQYEQAIKYYTIALSLKEDPAFYSSRSACYHALFYPDKVIEDTTSALNLEPKNTKCLMRRSRAFEYFGKFEHCIHDLYALKSISSGFNTDSTLNRVITKHCLNILQNSAEKDDDLPNASTIHSILKGLEEDQVELEISSLDSESGDYHLTKALAYFNKKTNDSYVKAEPEFIKAVDAFAAEIKANRTTELKAKLSMALEYTSIYKVFRYQQMSAETDIQTAIELHPRPRTYLIATFAIPKPNISHSLEMVDEAVNVDTNSSETYLYSGKTYSMGQDLMKAKKSFEKSIELNPQTPEPYIQLGHLLSSIGCLEKAKDVFETTKVKFQTCPDVPYEYGEMLLKNGLISEAIDEWEISYKLQFATPKVTIGSSPLVMKAFVLVQDSFAKNAHEAVKLLEEAIAYDPKYAMAKIRLANIKEQLNEKEDAIKLYESASHLTSIVSEKLGLLSNSERLKNELRVENHPIYGDKH